MLVKAGINPTVGFTVNPNIGFRNGEEIFALDYYV